MRPTALPVNPDWRDDLGHYAAERNFSTGTLEALLATGDIRLVQSEPLRATIISLADGVEQSRRWFTVLDQEGLANAHAHIRYMDALSFVAGRPGTLPIEHYRRTPELSGSYATHRSLLENYIDGLEGLRDEFAGLGAMIEGDGGGDGGGVG